MKAPSGSGKKVSKSCGCSMDLQQPFRFKVSNFFSAGVETYTFFAQPLPTTVLHKREDDFWEQLPPEIL
jgi:hypothetical protein